MSGLRQTMFPSTCPHCSKLFGRPPSVLRVLEAMSPGYGVKGVVYTAGAVSRNSGMGPQHAHQAVLEAEKAGLIERATEVSGAKAYRKTNLGTQLLSRWKTAGWKPSKLLRAKPRKALAEA